MPRAKKGPPGDKFIPNPGGNPASIAPYAFTPETAPRTGGWPDWRRALRRVVGDGSMLFEVLAEIVSGKAVPVVNPATGEQLTEPVYAQGYEVGRKPIWSIPDARTRLAAAEALADRAFGRPVQVVLDVTPNGDGQGEYVPAADLTEAERGILREIAKRRMLATRVIESQPIRPEDDSR